MRGRVIIFLGSVLSLLAAQSPASAQVRGDDPAPGVQSQAQAVHSQAQQAVHMAVMMAEITSHEYARSPQAEYLTVDIRLDRHTLEAAFSALSQPRSYHSKTTDAGQGLCLPLGALTRLLEFAISVDVDNERAEGWFIDESRRFSLDVGAGVVEVGGHQHELPADAICPGDDDVYVAVEMLQEWFPIDFTFDYREMVLELDARETLPLQERLERERRREMKMANKHHVRTGPTHEVVTSPYSLVDWPVHDIRLRGNLRDAPSGVGVGGDVPLAGASGSYSVRGAGDLLFMGGRWSVAGNRQHPISQVRVTLERKDPGGQLGGELGLTHVAGGDVVSPSRALLARGYSGRGTIASNVPLTRPTHFDHTSLHGELEEGWEVELYRNNALIDFQMAPVDGRYYFDDVPLLFGKNKFRLVFYGPYGQQRTEYQERLVGLGMIQPGESQYRVYAAQQGVDTIDITSSTTQRPQDGAIRAMGEFDYGLSQTLSLTSAVATIPGPEEQRFYAELGVSGSFRSLASSLSLAHQFGEGAAGRLALQTQWAKINLTGEHIQTLGVYQSETFSASRSTLASHSEVALNSVVPMPGRLSVPMQLSATYDRWHSGSSRGELSHRMSARLWNVYTTHKLRWQTVDLDRNFVISQAQAQLRREMFALQLRLNTDLAPQSQVRSYSAGVSTEAGDWGVRVQALHYPGRHIDGRAAVRRRFDILDAGIEGSLDSKGQWRVLASVSTSIGRDPADEQWRLQRGPLTNHGSVVAQFYEDRDQNGRFEKSDRPLQSVVLEAAGQGRDQPGTNDDGIVVLEGLQSYKYVDLEINRDSLESPFALPARDAVTTVIRPGKVLRVDFPIVMGGEIEGSLYDATGDGLRPSAGVKLQLLSQAGEVVAKSTSAFDGFYLFNLVAPGAYRIRIAPEQAEAIGLVLSEDPQVFVEGDGSITYVDDLHAQSASAKIEQNPALILADDGKGLRKDFPGGRTAPLRTLHPRTRNP